MKMQARDSSLPAREQPRNIDLALPPLLLLCPTLRPIPSPTAVVPEILPRLPVTHAMPPTPRLRLGTIPDRIQALSAMLQAPNGGMAVLVLNVHCAVAEEQSVDA